MIQKPFNKVLKKDIESLIENKVSESRTIEYKEGLAASSDSDKKEFLADVSSFANSSGGDLLFGVREENGFPVEAVGLHEFHPDDDVLRLENIIREGIQPRIIGIQTKTIDRFPKGPILLIRIPESWEGPHMVCFQRSSRFFKRNSRGKYPMDIGEIRSAFVLSEALPERIRRFRDDRLAVVAAGETPLHLAEGPTMVLHIIPRAAFSTAFRLSAQELGKQGGELHPLQGGYNRSRFNLDGFLTMDGDTEPFRGYCQAFGTGQLSPWQRDSQVWIGRTRRSRFRAYGMKRLSSNEPGCTSADWPD